MTGVEHYREAERLIAEGEHDETSDAELVLRDIALAQVHATLALADAMGAVRDAVLLTKQEDREGA